MSTTHVGKIGRLPKGIRDELGRRIEDGEPGKDLVEWLNGLPEAQEVLKEQFGGREINEQNLSDWKQGGHPEWLRAMESRELAASLAEEGGLAEESAGVSDQMGAIMAIELARLARELVDRESDPEKRWARLCEVNRELSRMRRDDHRGIHAHLAHERWIWELEADHLKSQKEHADRQWASRLEAGIMGQFRKSKAAGRSGTSRKGKKGGADGLEEVGNEG